MSHKYTSKLPDMRFFLHCLRSGLWTRWTKLAYWKMLTIRGRLNTSFILGSMSVGLNILICHSVRFMSPKTTTTHVYCCFVHCIFVEDFRSCVHSTFDGFLIYFKQIILASQINSNQLQIEQILPIPRHLFLIWIYVYLMAPFPPIFMINGTILILI